MYLMSPCLKWPLSWSRMNSLWGAHPASGTEKGTGGSFTQPTAARRGCQTAWSVCSDGSTAVPSPPSCTTRLAWPLVRPARPTQCPSRWGCPTRRCRRWCGRPRYPAEWTTIGVIGWGEGLGQSDRRGACAPHQAPPRRTRSCRGRPPPPARSAPSLMHLGGGCCCETALRATLCLVQTLKSPNCGAPQQFKHTHTHTHAHTYAMRTCTHTHTHTHAPSSPPTCPAPSARHTTACPLLSRTPPR
jgi:hypothetical protein